MLWRTSYQTEIYRDVRLAVEETGVVLYAFHPLGHTELGIWMRLLEEAFPTGPSVQVQWIIPAGALWRRELPEIFPPSMWAKMSISATALESETPKIPPVDPQRVCAALVHPGGLAEFVMIGPPTEEAWDEFRLAVERFGANLAP